jgi:hypothetical protein
MATLKWYNIINLDTFEATGLVSRTVQVVIGTLGLKDVLVTKGNKVSLLYDDTFLSIDLNDKNPFEQDNRLVYLDDNNDIWLGLLE